MLRQLHSLPGLGAALRETAILFARAIAALLLGERLGPGRLAAAALVALGAISLRLA